MKAAGGFAAVTLLKSIFVAFHLLKQILVDKTETLPKEKLRPNGDENEFPSSVTHNKLIQSWQTGSGEKSITQFSVQHSYKNIYGFNKKG